MRICLLDIKKVSVVRLKVSLLSGLNLKKSEGFSSPGTKETLRNKEASVLSWCP